MIAKGRDNHLSSSYISILWEHLQLWLIINLQSLSLIISDPNATVTTHESISICTSGGVTLEFLAPIVVLILLNVITGIIASIIIFMLVKSKRKIGLELERSRVKVKETQLPQHGLYEELDYVQMQTDSSKVVSVKHNVSYSSITDMKPDDSELPL